MKKIVPILAVFVILGTLLVIFADRLFTISLDHPDIHLEEVSTELPLPKKSSIYLPIEVSFSALEHAINTQVPKRFSGTKLDFTNALKKDQINWHVDRGNIQVSGGEKINLKVDANGKANASGKIDLKLLTHSVSATAHVSSSLHLSSDPKINSTWHIDPQVSGNVVVHKAEIPIKHVGSISIREEVKKVLDREKNKFISTLNQRVAKDESLKKEAAKAWNKLFIVEKISNAPSTWLKVTPFSIKASQLQISSDSIRLGLGIEFTSELVVGDNAPNNPTTSLPYLTLESPDQGMLNVNLLAEVPWNILSEQLNKRFANQPIPLSTRGEAQINNISLAPVGDQILLSAQVTAQGSWIERARGTLVLMAHPRLDTENEQLHLEKITYAVQEGVLVKTAAWLFESDLLDQLQKVSTIDLSQLIVRAKKEVQESADKLLGKLPEGVSGSIEVDWIKLEQFIPTKEQLFLSLDVQAKLNTTVTELKI